MYTINTSSGKIIVDHRGIPVDDRLPLAYSDVIQFDIKEFKSVCLRNHAPMTENIDVTEIGYWLNNHRYVPAIRVPSRYTKED